MDRVGSLAALACAAALLSACVPGAVNLHGKRCPCGQGWVCNPETNTCVEALADAAFGSVDSGQGVDAGHATDGHVPDDAGAFDAAAPPDGAPIDTGIMDAASPDAGPMDAGAADAGPDDTACDDILSGALFCSGFEPPGFGEWVSGEMMNGTEERETTVTYRGLAALHARTDSFSGYADWYADLGSTITVGELYARVYVYVPSGFTASAADFLDVDGTDNGMFLGVGAGDSVFAYFDKVSRQARSGPSAIVRDRWTCVQVHVTVGLGGSVDLSVDGTVVAGQTGVDTTVSGGYDTVGGGLVWTDPTQASSEVYVDEVAVGTSPLPCNP